MILVKDVSETDRFGRLLRYVYLLDGTFVNAELVRLGFAQVATFPPDVRHVNTFTQLQGEARQNGMGLWSAAVVEATSPPPPQPTAPPPTQPPPTQPPDPTQPPQPTVTPPTTTTEPQPTEPPAPAPGQVVINFILFDGAVSQVESDEYAVITNQGGSTVNLGGWKLNAGSECQDFWFPSFDLQPDQSCRVYTNEAHPDTCGFSFGSGQALWRNSGDCGYLFDAGGALVSEYCF